MEISKKSKKKKKKKKKAAVCSAVDLMGQLALVQKKEGSRQRNHALAIRNAV